MLVTTKVSFDMDGVLCDWVHAFESNCDVPLEVFNTMATAEKNAIKEALFTYDFFRNMRPIAKGMAMLAENIEFADILSASGYINAAEVRRAKLDWIAEHVGDIEVKFVDKVEMKGQHVDSNIDVHILVDDRQKAIDAWVAAGGRGVLFV
jgi:5'(3')-deoxyribonucleotidase